MLVLFSFCMVSVTDILQLHGMGVKPFELIRYCKYEISFLENKQSNEHI